MERRVSFIMVIFAILLVISIPIRADEENGLRKDSLVSGSWAVQFAISGYLNVAPFGGMISVKYHLKDRSALRLGIGYTQRYEIEKPLYAFDHKQIEYDFTVELPYLSYPSADRDVKLYWGVGPEFGYRKSEEYYGRFKNGERRYSIGLLGILGFEWFATKEISLHAEYQARVSYSNINGYLDSEKNSYTGYGWNAETNMVLFGLSVYF